MAEKVVFIAADFLPPVGQLIPEILAQGKKLFIASSDSPSAEFSAVLRDNGCPSLVCHCAVSDGLADTANEVIKCAESFGGIDVLIYAARQFDSEKLFLDIEPREAEKCAAQIRELFAVCKCAVPYMMGRENPCMLFPVNHDAGSALGAAYCGACTAAANVMSGEFSDYGLTVKTIGADTQEILENITAL